MWKRLFAIFSLMLMAAPVWAAGGFTWSHAILFWLEAPLVGLVIDPRPILDMLFAAAIVVTFAYIAGKPFRQGNRAKPNGQADLANFAEVVVGGMQSFLQSIIRHGLGARPVFPLLGTYALLILVMNLLGLVPGFNPPTDQFNLTIMLGVVIFIVTHYLGVKVHGGSYIKQFTGPLWWLAPLMLPIELISHCVRPLSLAIRLFGNMTGDHKVVFVFSSIFPFLLPVPFMGLGILISVLQAFVFVMLSAIYFESAMGEAH